MYVRMCVCAVYVYVVVLKIIVAIPDEYSLAGAESLRAKATDLLVMCGGRVHGPIHYLFNHRLCIYVLYRCGSRKFSLMLLFSNENQSSVLNF